MPHDLSTTPQRRRNRPVQLFDREAVSADPEAVLLGWEERRRREADEDDEDLDFGGDRWRAIELGWKRLTKAKRHEAIQKWARDTFEVRLLPALRYPSHPESWSAFWTKARRWTKTGVPHRGGGPGRSYDSRAALVCMLDWRDMIGLKPRRGGGPLGGSSRFLSPIEYTWLALGAGLWPSRHKTSLGPRGVVRAERANMEKAIDRHGQRPTVGFEGSEAAADSVRARFARFMAKSQPTEKDFVRWRVLRGKLDR